MSWKSITCVAVMCALMASQALAAPTIDVVGAANGGNTDWTVSFTPDPTLLANNQGSMAIEVAFEFATSMNLVGTPVIDPNWMETVGDEVVINPGHNPYTSGTTEGIQFHANVPSELGGGGNVNALFASLGSTLFQTDGPKTAFSFTTSGATGSLDYEGIIAQITIFDVMGSAIVAPELLFGDANNDLVVNGFDLLAVGDNFGSIGAADGLLLGDADDNGVVNGFDLLAVGDNFGATAAGSLQLSAAQVPEPSSVAIIGIAGLLGGAWARYRRRS